MFAEADIWSPKILLQNNFNQYSDSMVRDSAYSAGSIFSFDKLDRTHFSVGYQYTTVKALNANPDDLDSIKGHRFYLSGSHKLFFDTLPGITTIRLDGYSAQSKHSVFVAGTPGKKRPITTLTDQLLVINPIISFGNFSKTRFYELGYALSSYEYPDRALAGAKVHQLSPAFGFALGQQSDWIQLRAYFIELDNNTVTTGPQDSKALELKWTHWLQPDSLLGLNNIGFQVISGERLFAVDPDAAEVYSLADIQTQMAAVFGQWQIADQTQILAHVSWQEFKNPTLGNRYNSSSFYINFSHQW